MIHRLSRPPIRPFLLPVLLAALVLLLASCAPPNVAHKTELARLRQEQSQMAQELQKLREQLASLQSTPAPEAPAPPTPGVAQVPADAAAVYREAFLNLIEDRFTEAVDGFSRFLTAYPDSPQRVGARYWLGHALAGAGRTEEAIATFQQLLQEAPESSRAPAALVHMAALYRRLNQPEQAEQALALLRSRYPDSPELRRIERQKNDAAQSPTEGKQ